MTIASPLVLAQMSGSQEAILKLQENRSESLVQLAWAVVVFGAIALAAIIFLYRSVEAAKLKKEELRIRELEAKARTAEAEAKAAK